MKVILKIGSTDVLLPDDKGVSTIMKALARGVEVWDSSYGDHGEIEIQKELRLEMKMVARAIKITGPKPELAEEQEQLTLPAPRVIYGK